MGEIGWKSELSLIDEFFGKVPRYPLATEIEHQAYEYRKQNQLMSKLSLEQQLKLQETTNQICGTLNNGVTELVVANKNALKTVNNSLENGFNIVSSGLENLKFGLENLEDGVENLEYALESGFKDVVSHIQETNRNLEQIDSSLRWGFGGIVDKISISNIKLDEIIQLLNIPDSQKQRKYHIEEGLRCLIKTRSDDFFYSKAEENFSKAITIEELDYLSLQQLGIIHLYSKTLLNVEKAKKYLEDSIKYSSAEIGIVNFSNSSSFNHLLNPSVLTAKSSLHLARCYYILGDFHKAYETANLGLKYRSSTSLLFDLSKYSSKLMKINESVDFLRRAIENDRYISVKALNDEDLSSEQHILDYLKNLTKSTIKLAEEETNNIRKLISIKSPFINSIEHSISIEPIEKQLNKKQYLRALHALELIGYELNN